MSNIITGTPGLVKDKDGNIKFPHTIDNAVHMSGENNGKTLDEMINGLILKTKIANNLTTTDEQSVLSAAQGVVINNELTILKEAASTAAAQVEANKTNIETVQQTLTNVPTIEQLSKCVNSIEDLNDISETNGYINKIYSPSTVNVPLSAGSNDWGMASLYNVSSTNYIQVLISLTNKIYIRSYIEGQWGSYKVLTLTEDSAPASAAE